MARKFSKWEIAAMLEAAGVSLDDVQTRATAALQATVDTAQYSIDANKAVIAEAQREITEATTELKAAQVTLSVVKSIIGG